ncbi:hypothetical protein EDD15DRAFT_2372950 [Pisolithus albus]|nr:hypothetical protein EDD15DRAFT_2372950 [Pisolithus albus]
MATHQCVDWSRNPPARKIDVIVISHVNLSSTDRASRVRIIAQQDLDRLAREEFNLGDADLEFYSSCIKLCNVDIPARIGEPVWEYIKATSHPTPPPPEQSVKTSIHDGESELPMNEDERHDSSYVTADKSSGEGVPEDVDLRTDGGNIEKREEVGNRSPGRGRVSSPVEDTRTTDDEQGSQGNGLVMRKRPARQNVPESEEEEEPVARRRKIVNSGQEDASPPSSSQFGTRGSTARSRKRMPRSPTKPMFTQVPRGTQQEGQERIYIIVAHRRSKQESKFAVKGSTKVSKVISSVCKSFDLDASHAKLFLIIDTTDEDGIMENLFPCDADDSMMRVGAEASNESKFLLMLPEDL